MYTHHAHGAMRKNSHAIEKKSMGVKRQKSLCTHEFAMSGHIQLRTWSLEVRGYYT